MKTIAKQKQQAKICPRCDTHGLVLNKYDKGGGGRKTLKCKKCGWRKEV